MKSCYLNQKTNKQKLIQRGQKTCVLFVIFTKKINFNKVCSTFEMNQQEYV